MIPINDLSRNSDKNIKKELNLIKSILTSGNYLKGSFTSDFENYLATRVQKPYALGVSSGTAALKIAFLSIGLQRNDLIATVANAGGYSTSAAKSLGLKVGLIDINLENHQMSFESLMNFFQQFPETRAVVITHLYGQVGNVDLIRDLCNQKGVILIEDCAQSFGAKFKGVEAGGFGDISTFSFYPTKNLGAAGDAGGLAFKDVNHYEKALKISQYGWSDRYKIECEGGFNSRIDEIQSAILLSRSERLDEENKIRREILISYKKSISSNLKILGNDDESNVAHLAVVVSPNRDLDMENFRNNDVATAIHYPYVDALQPAWEKTFVGSEIPNTIKLNKEIFTIPCFPGLRTDEIEKICSLLRSL